MYAFIKGLLFRKTSQKCKTLFYKYFPEALLALKVSKTFICLLAFILACFSKFLKLFFACLLLFLLAFKVSKTFLCLLAFVLACLEVYKTS